jgi:alpha-galactosidase
VFAVTKFNRREFMQASTATLLLRNANVSALPGSAVTTDESAIAFVRTNSEGKSWTVGNALVEREIQFDPKVGLYTESWTNKATGKNFLKRLDSDLPWGAEFSFRADGTLLAGASRGPHADFDWVAAETTDIAPEGKRLEVKLKSARKSLELSAFYAVYSGHPVIRKWIGITNRTGQVIRLSHLVFEALNLEAAPPSEQSIFAYYGVHPREIFFTGRAEDAAILAKDPRTGEGFIVMNEAPGWMKRTEMTNWGDGIQVMYDTDLFPFERSLDPGETFTSAKSGVAFFVEGHGMADPHWVMPTYTSHVLMKKGTSYQPPWFYNTWEPFFQDYDDTIVTESIPAASQLGFDVFTLDTGWSENYGENEINSKKFPKGFDDFRAALESKGMRLGLWEPLVVMGPESRVVREHPEWIIRDLQGNEKTAAFPGPDDRVMCLASAYRDWAARRINELISRHNLRYVKIDLTTVFNAYGEAPGCYAQGHYHRNWAESLGGIYEGIQFVTEQVYREHPEVLLDLTFELWGQKHIIDYGLLDAGDLDWMSNVDDTSTSSAGPRQVRTLLYHRAMAIPVETMLIGNLRASTATLEEHFATVIGSAPLFLGDLRKLTPQQVTWLAEKIRWFKEFRRVVPIQQGFFPLGEWRQPNLASWDGFARLSRRGEGILVLFKNESHCDSVTVQLPAFPDGSFLLRSIMTGQALEPQTHEQFRRGLRINLPAQHKVEILEIRQRRSNL